MGRWRSKPPIEKIPDMVDKDHVLYFNDSYIRTIDVIIPPITFSVIGMVLIILLMMTGNFIYFCGVTITTIVCIIFINRLSRFWSISHGFYHKDNDPS